MTKRLQIGHDGTSGHKKANDEVGQYLQSGQGQVGGPQVPPACHGDDKETPNWACWNEWTGIGTWTPASLGGKSHPLLLLSQRVQPALDTST